MRVQKEDFYFFGETDIIYKTSSWCSGYFFTCWLFSSWCYVCCIGGRGQKVSLMTPNLYFFHSPIPPTNNNPSHKQLKETHVDLYNILRRCNVPLKKPKCFNCILWFHFFWIWKELQTFPLHPWVNKIEHIFIHDTRYLGNLSQLIIA